MRPWGLAMAWRVFAILVAGIVASAMVTVALTASRHQRELEALQNARTAERLGEAIAVLQSVPRERRPSIRPFDLRIRGITGITWRRDERGARDAMLTDALRAQIGGDGIVTIRRLPPEECDERPPPPPPGLPPHDRPPGAGDRPEPPLPDGQPMPPFEFRPACERVSLTLVDGTPLSIDVALHTPAPRRDLAPPMWPLLIFAACVGVLAYIVSRMATRPIARLADAARQLGDDIDRPPLDETRGPFEVRRAAAAFNAMQTRIRHHMQERTQMLAAISHDLQTPLTRLRLRLEKVGDPALRDKLIEDMQAMQGIVREGLDLARSIDGSEARVRVDIDSLVQSLCADEVDAGRDVVVRGTSAAAVMASPTALRRCLGNLVDNAIKYGRRAEVGIARDGSRVSLTVRDAGPGIPDAEIDRVFDPFYRIEGSRSRETGGTGLGLTIARNIAGRLGGALTLRNHPDGGLEARLVLPMID